MGKGRLRGEVILWTVQNQQFDFISKSTGVIFLNWSKVLFFLSSSSFTKRREGSGNNVFLFNLIGFLFLNKTFL